MSTFRFVAPAPRWLRRFFSPSELLMLLRAAPGARCPGVPLNLETPGRPRVETLRRLPRCSWPLRDRDVDCRHHETDDKAGVRDQPVELGIPTKQLHRRSMMVGQINPVHQHRCPAQRQQPARQVQLRPDVGIRAAHVDVSQRRQHQHEHHQHDRTQRSLPELGQVARQRPERDADDRSKQEHPAHQRVLAILRTGIHVSSEEMVGQTLAITSAR